MTGELTTTTPVARGVDAPGTTPQAPGTAHGARGARRLPPSLVVGAVLVGVVALVGLVSSRA